MALRPSLLPGLLTVLGHNLRAGRESVRLFELARVFAPASENEERHLAIVFCGNTEDHSHWRSAGKRQLDFFDVKGAIETIAAVRLSFRRTKKPDLAIAVQVLVDDQPFGLIGQLITGRISEVDGTRRVFVAEINFETLLQRRSHNEIFRELEKFPAITRDIAMIVPAGVSHAAILAAIESVKEPLLERVELFDLFSGEETEIFGVERKSLAYTLTYRDKNRTLTNDEITVVHAKIRERLQRELGVELRE